ncbi:MAG: FadR family transcriptional regulator [Rhodospirillales bacterium]|nr:FadR family transcriptional regulator [Rhodospirillales bacterium]
MGPVKKVRLSESMVDAIKQMIVDDGFAPGDKFYSENELTAKLGVSRSSVREAVRILEVVGQLSVKHGKGIFIVNTDAHPFEGFVDWLKNNDQSLQEHFEVRLIVEPQTARLAALGAKAEDVALLERTHAAFVRNARLGLTAETIQCDREFHKLLARAAHNKVLFALTRSITTALFDDWISSFHTPGRMEKTVGEHGLVLAAVKAGDAEAAMEHMATHLKNAIRDIRKSSTH